MKVSDLVIIDRAKALHYYTPTWIDSHPGAYRVLEIHRTYVICDELHHMVNGTVMPYKQAVLNEFYSDIS